MKKYSFSKSTISNISKFSIDKKYFFFIIPIIAFFSINKIISNFSNFGKNILQLFPNDIRIDTEITPNLFSVFLFFFTNYICLIFTAFIIRFCIGIILIKSQIKVQRFISIIISFIYIFTSENSGYLFNKSIVISDFSLNISSFFNFIFIIFITISIIILFLNFKNNSINIKSKLFALFFIIITYLFYDWNTISVMRKNAKLNINNTNIYFIVENIDKNKFNLLKETSDYSYIKNNFHTYEDDLQLVSNNNIVNYSTILTGLMPYESGVRNDIPNSSTILYLNNFLDIYRKKNKFIYISNIGNPSSLGGLIKNFDGGIVCDNDIKSIYKYQLIENLNPLLTLLPNSFVLKYIPSTFCLKSFSNVNQNILSDFYHGINTNTEKEKVLISFIKQDEHENIFDIVENINETLETNNINIKIIFIDSKSFFAKILYLTKHSNHNIDNNSIDKFISKEITNYSSNNKLKYQEINNDITLKNTVLNEGRISLNFADLKIFSMNLSRNFECDDNNNKFILSYKKDSNSIPQKIILKNNLIENMNNCKTIISNSYINDISIMLNENIFNKMFIFFQDKL